jgi:hypothetical protein
MTFEIPQQKDQKENYDEHKNAEIVPRGIGTAP